MPNLYILCGPSGCGKTTWANNFMKEHEQEDIRYVSRDEIRFSMLEEDDDYFKHEKEVFRKFVNTIAQTLVDGFDVIADATHLNKFSREKLTQHIDEYTYSYNIIYVVFNTSYITCVMHDMAREGRSHVGESTIRGMFRSFKAPTFDEDGRITQIIQIGKKGNDFSFLMEPYRKE